MYLYRKKCYHGKRRKRGDFMLNNLIKKIEQNQFHIYSLAVMNSEGMQETRIHPADLATNSYSVAKAFTMTAIGMLWDQGRIRVEDSVYEILQDEFPEGFDSRWKEVTVEHLLTHKAGFGRGFLDIDVEDISEYALEAIAEWGFFVGGALSVWRILRCNPFGGCGHDPVPKKKRVSRDTTENQRPDTDADI